MHDSTMLRELVVIFGAALVVVLVLSRLRLPTIAGFLVAGAAIGPSGLAWVGDPREIERLAELGVVLLLFTIGLEFSFAELRRLGRVLAIGGGLQTGLTTAAVAGIAVLAGFGVAKGTFLGFLVALSSTAIVLKGLTERGETDAPHGRLVVGILLFQDMSVVPMILLLPLLAGEGGGAAGIARVLLVAGAVVAATLLLARRVVPRVLQVVANTRRRDLFILAVVVICGAIAWLTSLAGLSLALGAFLAGMVLADSEQGHQALSDVLPLRDIFTSLFFVSMGMLLDVRVLLHEPAVVLGLVTALLVGKTLIVMLAGLLLRFPLRVALLAGLSLSQVGEFSFVLASLGSGFGLLSDSDLRLFFAASVLTMLVTPFALRFGPHLAAAAGRLRALDQLLGPRDEELVRKPPGLADHVVVLGYGVGGAMLAEALRSVEVPHAVVDLNAERVREARQRGEPVYYGDVTSPEILEGVQVARARQVAVMLNDPDATLRAVRAVRRLAPRASIVARARYVADVPKLRAAGANEAVAQEFEASLEIIGRLMAALGIERHAGSAGAAPLPPGLNVETVATSAGAWIAGRSLAEAALRSRTGATLLSVSRGARTAVHPSAADRIEAGDVVCLVGDAEQLAAARHLFETGPA
jgi:monovalent cation:H+ antiporter-2, CPA2 family